MIVFKSRQQSYLPAPELPTPWPPDGPEPELSPDGSGTGTGPGMPPDVATPPAPVDNVVND